MCDTGRMLPTLAAVLFYLIAAAILVRDVARGVEGRAWKVPAALAVLDHAWLHVAAWHRTGVPDMHFFAALSLVALGMAAVTTVLGARRQLDAIGVVVFPLAAVFAACYSFFGHAPQPAMTWQVQLHAWLALFADDVGAQTAEERRSAELDARAVLIMAAGAAMYVSTIAADDDSTELEERMVELLTTGYRAVAANRQAADGQA